MTIVDFLGPSPQKDWALFLDVDGTLLDIADEPDAVVVPATLVDTLAAVRASLGGALAVVSGRSLDQVDRLLEPLRLPGAGEHGAEIRLPHGEIRLADAACTVPETWRQRLSEATESWLGVIVENKPFGVAVHFRKNPERKEDVKRLMHEVVGERCDAFHVLSARQCFEIRHRSLHKGAAVETLMSSAPFLGRTPIFVGDDVTDEDGFAAAKARGGLGLHVRDVFDGQPSQVRRWLEAFCFTDAGET